VRAALRQEFRAQFDQDYRPRWTRAAGHWNWPGVLDTVEHWRMHA
jgi:uncharacterized protein DUF6247